MCILLLYVCAEALPGRYRVILASNRDEYFTRPAKPAHFWERTRNVVAGMDMTPGKEGGTWLGASPLGKLAVLLNVSGAPSDPNKLGRGFLVSDFISTSETTDKYFTQLEKEASAYNPFHLVTVDVTDPTPLRHFCNVNPKLTVFGNGCHAFCNSSLDRPYLKAVSGRDQLEDIVSRLGQSTDTKTELVSSLIGLLRSEKRHHPDPVIAALSTIAPEMRAPLSAICVRPSAVSYGTRTHSIILVDGDGSVDFYEWTLKVPIENGVFDWVETHLMFKLEPGLS